MEGGHALRSQVCRSSRRTFGGVSGRVGLQVKAGGPLQARRTASPWAGSRRASGRSRAVADRGAVNHQRIGRLLERAVQPPQHVAEHLRQTAALLQGASSNRTACRRGRIQVSNGLRDANGASASMSGSAAITRRPSSSSCRMMSQNRQRSFASVVRARALDLGAAISRGTTGSASSWGVTVRQGGAGRGAVVLEQARTGGTGCRGAGPGRARAAPSSTRAMPSSSRRGQRVLVPRRLDHHLVRADAGHLVEQPLALAIEDGLDADHRRLVGNDARCASRGRSARRPIDPPTARAASCARGRRKAGTAGRARDARARDGNRSAAAARCRSRPTGPSPGRARYSATVTPRAQLPANACV